MSRDKPASFYVREYLRSLPIGTEFTAKEIVEKTHEKYEAVTGTLSRLEQAGALVAIGRLGRAAVYRLDAHPSEPQPRSRPRPHSRTRPKHDTRQRKVLPPLEWETMDIAQARREYEKLRREQRRLELLLALLLSYFPELAKEPV